MDLDADLIRLVARSRADADVCRAAAARVESLGAVRWSSAAAERFREQTTRRAQRLRAVGEDCETLACWLERLACLVRGAEGPT